MLTTLLTSTPLQLAHKAIRREPALVMSLNTMSRITYRPVGDIVLLICLQAYCPEMALSYSTWPMSIKDLREDLQATLYARLRAKKAADGTPVSTAITRALHAWLAENPDALRPQQKEARPEGMNAEQHAWAKYEMDIMIAVGRGEITPERGRELLGVTQMVTEGGLTPSGWPC